MALTRYVVTAAVTLPQGTVITTPTAGEPGTGGAAGYGNVVISAGYGAFPQTIVAGQVMNLIRPLRLARRCRARSGRATCGLRVRPG